jgi:hypothetical protein
MDCSKVLSDLIAIDTSVPPGRNYEKNIEDFAQVISGFITTE